MLTDVLTMKLVSLVGTDTEVQNSESVNETYIFSALSFLIPLDSYRASCRTAFKMGSTTFASHWASVCCACRKSSASDMMLVTIERREGCSASVE